jgi:hypothetical protein
MREMYFKHEYFILEINDCCYSVFNRIERA